MNDLQTIYVKFYIYEAIQFFNLGLMIFTYFRFFI